MADKTHSNQATKVLQERRAEVIGELYAKIAAAIRLTGSFVSPMQMAGDASQIEKAGTARAVINAAEEKFDDTQIWLTEGCAKKVEELMTELRNAYNHFAVYLGGPKLAEDEQNLREKHKAWIASWDSVSKTKVPAARRALEVDMRQLLAPPDRRPQQPDPRTL